jgi:hypothetical protein
MLLVFVGALWIAGLLAIVFYRRRAPVADHDGAARPATLAERLQPLVTQAVNGRLSDSDKAELERLLLAYWRRRLDLEDAKPGVAMARLREHDEAGAILRQLEVWLHAPDMASNVDVAELLRPYRDIPADENVGTAAAVEAGASR